MFRSVRRTATSHGRLMTNSSQSSSLFGVKSASLPLVSAPTLAIQARQRGYQTMAKGTPYYQMGDMFDGGQGTAEMQDADLHGGASDMSLSSTVMEMDGEDIALRVRTAQANYSPTLYAITMFDSVDVFEMMLTNSMIPIAKPEQQVIRWFPSPRDVLRNPSILVEAVGEDRWAQLEPLLTDRLNSLEDTSPLMRECARCNVPDKEWVPLLRWIVSEGFESDFKDIVPNFMLSLANGKGPAQLELPEEGMARGACVGRLCMAAAQEYGRVDLGVLAIEILRLNGINLGYKEQKCLMMVQSKAGRRSLDWGLRSSGSISRAVNDWLTKYLPKVFADTQRSQELLQKMQTEAPAEDDKSTDDDEREKSAAEEESELRSAQDDEASGGQPKFAAGITSYFSEKERKTGFEIPQTIDLRAIEAGGLDPASRRKARSKKKVLAQEEVDLEDGV